MKRTNKSRAPARRPSTQRRPVSTGSGMGAKLLIMAAVVAAVVFGVAIFFKVGRVEVQGNTIYSSEKIMEASGLELGDNLLTVSRARVAGNVKAELMAGAVSTGSSRKLSESEQRYSEGENPNGALIPC